MCAQQTQVSAPSQRCTARSCLCGARGRAARSASQCPEVSGTYAVSLLSRPLEVWVLARHARPPPRRSTAASAESSGIFPKLGRPARRGAALMEGWVEQRIERGADLVHTRVPPGPQRRVAGLDYDRSVQRFTPLQASSDYGSDDTYALLRMEPLDTRNSHRLACIWCSIAALSMHTHRPSYALSGIEGTAVLGRYSRASPALYDRV